MAWSQWIACNRRLIAGLVLVFAVGTLAVLYLPRLERTAEPHSVFCAKYYETPAAALQQVESIEGIGVRAQWQWLPPGWSCSYKPYIAPDIYRSDPSPVRGAIALTSALHALGSLIVVVTTSAAIRRNTGATKL